MADEPKPSWYEFPTLTKVPLSVQDVEYLRDMFESHPGWKVMEKVLRAEASRAGSDALDHTRAKEARELDMVQFYAHVWALQFKDHLEACLADTQPQHREELMLRDDPTLLDLIFAKNT